MPLFKRHSKFANYVVSKSTSPEVTRIRASLFFIITYQEGAECVEGDEVRVSEGRTAALGGVVVFRHFVAFCVRGKAG